MEKFYEFEMGNKECSIEIVGADLRAKLSVTYDKKIKALDADIEKFKKEIEKTENQLKRYVSDADFVDCAFSVFSGLATGLISVFFAGEFSFKSIAKKGRDDVEGFVKMVAEKAGCKENSMEGVIKWLEDRYKMASDKSTPIFGGGKQHHLRDFAHHPTLVGLAFSILTQFTQKVYGTDTSGTFLVSDVEDTLMIGKDTAEKLSLGCIGWFFHLVSDMAGSSGTYVATVDGMLPGTGIPGFIGATLKEMSALPFFRGKEGANALSLFVSKLYNGTLLAKREGGKIVEVRKFDLRTEIGIAHKLLEESLPVLLNECFVRGFYTVRRLIWQIKEKNIRTLADLDKIDFEEIKPFNNGTIVRMLTVATGTFTAVDCAAAAVDAAVKTGGQPTAFFGKFMINVNYVGVARFSFAIGSELNMEYKKRKYTAKCRDLNYDLSELKVIKSVYINSKACEDIKSAYVELLKLEEKMDREKEAVNKYYNKFEEIKKE